MSYKGIILKSETASDFQDLNTYIEETARFKGFKVEVVFERYNFNDSTARRERWMKAMRKNHALRPQTNPD